MEQNREGKIKLEKRMIERDDERNDMKKKNSKR
jgi:hypothetical protein